jgi:heat shock protein HslJ
MKMTRTLTLAGLAGLAIVVLVACGSSGPAANDPLEGTSWTLMAYRKTRPIPGTTLTATFEGGQVHGSAGCNTYRGPYEVDGDTIAMGALAITEMACLEPEGAMEQETLFMEFLQDARRYRLDEGQLQILRSDGEALTFVPRE